MDILSFFLYKLRQVYGHLNPRTHLVKVADDGCLKGYPAAHEKSMSNIPQPITIQVGARIKKKKW